MLQTGLKRNTLAPHLNKPVFILRLTTSPLPVIVLIGLLIFFSGCNNNSLPVYGPKTAVTATANGQTKVDSIDYTIPEVKLIDQDSSVVDASTVKNKVYVADFFFTSCPSICPKMMKEMGRVADKYKDYADVVILSYSIDPVRDSVARLKAYEHKLGINAGKWHLLTGNKDSIYALADKYLVSAAEDPDAPGGHIHSGNFILIDKQKRIRGYYDGTNDQKVDKLLTDMDILLSEK
jgi:protein SCO1/2